VGAFTCIGPFHFCVALSHLYRAFHYHMGLFHPSREPALSQGVPQGDLCPLFIDSWNLQSSGTPLTPVLAQPSSRTDFTGRGLCYAVPAVLVCN